MAVTLLADHQAEEPVDNDRGNHHQNKLWFSPSIEEETGKKQINILK